MAAYRPLHELCAETGTNPGDWQAEGCESPDEDMWTFYFRNIHTGDKAEVEYFGAEVKIITGIS